MNNFKIAFFLFLCLTTEAVCQSVPSSTQEDGFRNPPVSARPKALWPWPNGNVDYNQLTYEMEEAVRKGMGGFDIWDLGVLVDPDSVIPAGPAFLSDESVQAIAFTLREADRLGLEIGLTFSSSWNAGGSWVKAEDGAMGLFRSDTVVNGPGRFNHALPFPAAPRTYGRSRVIPSHNPQTGLPLYYKEVAVLAHPVSADSVIDPDKVIRLPLTRKGSKVSWQIPAGQWRIVRYVCAPTGQPLAIPSPNSRGRMLDHFSAQAQRNNMDYIFSRLIPFTGPLQNRSLKYLYADSYEVNSAVWTPLLPEAFAKDHGYAIEKLLPILDGFKVQDESYSERFLFDFKKTLSDLIIENHYRLGRRICESHGIGFVAEAGGPGEPIHNVPFEDLKALGSVSIPRGEFWNKHPQLELLQVIKGIASAAHIYNQKYVEAESFTSVWLWQEGPDELKPLADRAMCEGLNRFVYHTFPHTPRASGDPGWVYNFGTLINTTNGWWEKSESFHEYLARCSYLLQQGNFVGDIAYYYGDKAPNFTGPKKVHADPGPGFDYDVVNTEILLEKMEVRNGRIFLPHGQSYAILVLPNERAINRAVLQKLEKMVRDGATIIGPKPMRSLSLGNWQENDVLVKQLADQLWGNCDSVNVQSIRYGKGSVVWGRSIRDVLHDLGVGPDFGSAVDKDVLDYIHRKTDEEDIYFIRNKTDSVVTQLVSFRVTNRQPELWNPDSGETILIPVFESDQTNTKISLTLEPFESTFVVFRKGITQQWRNMTFNGQSMFDPANVASLRFTREGIQTSAAGEWKWTSGNSAASKTTREASLREVTGPWKLAFEKAKGAPPYATLESLKPLNESDDPRIRHYSGSVVYTTTVSIEGLKPNQRAILDLGEVREIADVYINGVPMGTAWHRPFKLDITAAVRTGTNFIRIDVVNTINNRLVGDAQLPPEHRRTSSNVKKLPNAWMNPLAEAPLLKSGLIGPVKIHLTEIFTAP